MNYKLVKQIKDNDRLRAGFNQLATKTFELSFEDWYQNGYWTDKYIPYVILDEKEVVANASVNRIELIWQGKPRSYIQIGTVMTNPEYRNQGLSRQILEEILLDWKDNCDGIYLFANDTVLDFYPKFGFEKETQYQYSMSASNLETSKAQGRKLDMVKENDRLILQTYYKKSNPFSKLSVVHNYELLMFYCSAFMKDFVYYFEEEEVVIIADQNEHTMTCFDIFCDENKKFEDIMATVIFKDTTNIVFEFTPRDLKNMTIVPICGEDTLFVLGNRENIFTENKLMFPALSHA